MKLTKSDFLLYLACKESLWLKKHKPAQFPQTEVTEFERKLSGDGYAVEEIAQGLFPGAQHDKSQNEIVRDPAQFFFQASFTDGEVMARTDILERLDADSWAIVEVKSSTRVKKDHLYDLAFQQTVLARCGFPVKEVFVMHCNKNYVRNGPLVAEAFLVWENVTEQVIKLLPEVKRTIRQALDYLALPSIDESRCGCLYKTKGSHCTTFGYFNQQVPEYSIYTLSNIREKQIQSYLTQQILDLSDVDEEKLTGRQKLEVMSYKQRTPIIRGETIRHMLDALVFPLYFYDYETYGEPIPFFDGMSPHQHLVFQVSVHKLDATGTLTHFEYLSDKLEYPLPLLDAMRNFTGQDGTFVSWNSSFENSRNKEMAARLPTMRPYLDYITAHSFDLMDVFKQDYVDYRSKGSISIKKILPILCPHLSYTTLEIQGGTAAQEGWRKLVFEGLPDMEKETLERNLLAYCELDTRAMVEIYQQLKKTS
ncbi:DUF2779 domain-containing protein [Parapedobacter sp. DT-150]|uniref:DUF2779 domain-containing protein n=1 Tax=Parapedobacter sp. DT-150 TaxID=3396162 RepID=UPI003F1C58F7